MGKPEQSENTRYVLSIRMTGLGDRLICLGAAWLFARNTGRTLLVDWNHGSYEADSVDALFPLLFEPTSELAGVAFASDGRGRRDDLPRPRHPAIWNNDALLGAPFLRPPDTVEVDRDAAVALIRSGQDVTAPTVVFDTCVNDGLVSVEDSRTFLRALRPAAPVAEKVAAFRRDRLGAGPIIGIHIRHGDGTPSGHQRYWESFDDSLERCRRAIRGAREYIGQDTPVFLCTDSAEVQHAVADTVQGVVSRRKHFRTAGEGELHVGPGAGRGREDALVEMLLLAEASALIRYPPGSFFSFYAAVMGRRGSLPVNTVYELQRPCDPEDPLSPALLL